MQFIKHTAAVFCFFVAMACCGCGQTKFEWYAAMSAPEHYVAGGPSIYYYKEGKGINGTSSNTGIKDGWGRGENWHSSNGKIGLPDQVNVNWISECENDMEYEGHFQLPYDKILQYFQQGYIDSAAKEKIAFTQIITGMAPGGNVVVWLGAENGSIVEIGRYKASPLGIWGENDPDRKKYLAEHRKAPIYIEDFIYWQHHGIPYAAWEQEEPAYPWGVGFISEDGEMQLEPLNMYSADGTYLNRQSRITLKPTQWNKPLGMPLQINTENSQSLTAKLPVHMKIQWGKGNFEQETEYYTDVVLPQDFKKKFLTPYINPQTGKQANYNRIIIGVKTGGKQCILWLDGPGKNEKLIEFEARKAIFGKNDLITSGGYAIPINNLLPKLCEQ